MAFLAAIGAAIGVIVMILWRLNQAGDAARGAMETASDIRGMSRGFLWRRKAKRHPMETLSDPREAVVAMMTAVANYDGAITDREQSTIISLIGEKFEATQQQADALLAHGRWLAKDVADLGDFMRRPLKLLHETCDQYQKADIIAMLRQTAAADGKDDDVITNAIDLLARRLAN